MKVTERAGEYLWEPDGSILVYVPPCIFPYGVPESADADPAYGEPTNRPLHKVELSGYFLGKYEVSNAQFERFVATTAFGTVAEHQGGNILRPNGIELGLDPDPKARWQRPHGTDAFLPDRPVVQVTWADACAYGEWAHLRLPTEAEWERAATWDAATQHKRKFPWGDDESLPSGARAANIREILRKGDSAEPLDRVTDHDEGASPVGALNMYGNAREWMLDAFDQDSYRKQAREGVAKDPCPSGGTLHVSRGGSFQELGGTANPTFRYVRGEAPDDTMGFRIALSVDGSPRPRSESNSEGNK
jgi:iron(II)-dependent oxidoreductase